MLKNHHSKNSHIGKKQAPWREKFIGWHEKMFWRWVGSSKLDIFTRICQNTPNRYFPTKSMPKNQYSGDFTTFILKNRNFHPPAKKKFSKISLLVLKTNRFDKLKTSFSILKIHQWSSVHE